MKIDSVEIPEFTFIVDATHVTMMYAKGGYHSIPHKGDVASAKQKLIGYEVKKAKHDAWKAQFKNMSALEKVSHKDYAYSRSRSYGVTIYARSEWSPTGVEAIGGMSHEEAKNITSVLSPTEGLQSAR